MTIPAETITSTTSTTATMSVPIHGSRKTVKTADAETTTKGEVLKTKTKRHKHDINTYNNAILKCGKNQRRALKIFETMNDWNVFPNLVTFNSLINVGYKSNNLSLVWDLFNKMSQKYEIFPNYKTYQILFGSMLKQKQYNDISQQFEIIKKQYDNSTNNKQELLTTIYHILPTTMISYSRSDKLEISKNLFEKWFNPKLQQNAMINTMVTLLTMNDDIDGSMDLLKKYNDCYCDNRAYISILKALTRTDSNTNYDKLSTIYDMAIEKCRKHNNLSIDIFNIMLSHCISSKKWSLCDQIWKDIESYKVNPDSITYIEYLQCLVYSLNLEKVPEIINKIIMKQREMKKKTLITQSLSTCMMWSAIETIRNLPDYHSSFNGLDPYEIFAICKHEFNILPNTDMYNEILYYSLKFLNYQQALVILDEMRELNLKLDIRTFNIFISGLGKLNQIDLIKELLQQIKELKHIKMNGSTYMNLLDAFAQNAEIELATKYLYQFIENKAENGFYVDKHCYGHLINCYANYFKKHQPIDDIDPDQHLIFMSNKLNDCLIHWNVLKTNKALNHSLNIVDYILILKCFKNFIVNINNKYGDDNSDDNYLYKYKINEIQQFAVNLFENDVLKLIEQDSNNKIKSNNKHTVFNILLDILYETREYDLALKYFIKAENLNIYSTLKLFDDKNKSYKLDLHEMRKNPAIFALLHYLKLSKQIHNKRKSESDDIESDKDEEYEIITGIGMSQHSIDWEPILQPMILEILDEKLSHLITYHVPSYNQGVIILDYDSLKTCFKSSKSIKFLT